MATDEEKLLLRLEVNATKLINETKKANDNFRAQMKRLDADFQTGNQKVVNGMANKVRAMNDGAAGMNRYRSAIQNTSYQIGDFAVQVAGGTSATRAAAQQLPQLLGGLGVFGAVAGAAAAILIPLAGNLFATENAMDSQVESVKALTKAMGELNAANNAANAANEDPMTLVDRFGAGGAEQAKKVLEIERRMAEVRAQAALSDVTRSIGGMGQDFGPGTAQMAEQLVGLRAEYDALSERILNFRTIKSEADQEELNNLLGTRTALDQQMLSLTNYETAMMSMADQFGLAWQGNEEAIGAVNAAMIELLAADTPAAMAAGGERLAVALLAASDNGRSLNEEGQQLLDHLNDSQLSALALARIDIASGIAAGADEAARLKGELAAAANAWLAARSLEQQHSAEMKYGARTTTDSRPVTLGDGTVYKPPSVGGGSGGRKRGGGGGVKAEDWLKAQADRAQAAYDAALAEADAVGLTGEAAERAKVKIELLAEAKKRNLNLDAASTKTGETLRAEIDRQAASIAHLTVQADQYREKAQFLAGINKTLEDGFLDAIVSGKGFAGVLGDVAKQLAKAALQAALFGNGPFAKSGGSGGLLGGLFSGIGGLLSFDGGGSTGAAPRSGGLDGKGGFLAMMHPQETVIDRTKGGTGGGGAVHLRIVSDPGVIVQIAKNEAGVAITQAGPAIVQRSVAATSRAAGKSKSFLGAR